ncbi:MAG: DUF4132 domain-containing protein [Isosphaerales bacterium]
MSRVQQALQKLESLPGIPVKLMEQYILTGDRKFLSQIQPVKPNMWSWDGNVLAGALARIPDWTEEDRRLLHVLFARGSLEYLADWLNEALRREKSTEDVISAVRAELASCKATTKDIVTLLTRVQAFARDGKPTSGGRYVLSLADPDLEHAVRHGDYNSINLINLEMIGFLLDFAPDRMPSLFPVLMKEIDHVSNDASAAGLILRKGGKRFEKEVHAFFESMKNTWHRFQLAQEFFEFDAAKYREEALEAARASLAGSPDSNNHGPIGEWMVEKFGKAVLPDLVDYLAGPHQNQWWKSSIVAAAARSLKQDSLPALQAALKTNDPELALYTLPHLIALRDDSEDKLILQTLERGFQDKSRAVRFITLAAQWKVSPLSESLWALMANKSKPVRDAAARALGRLGDVAVPRAGTLLLEKKADTRAAAVTLLTTVNSQEALKTLEKHVDDEPDEVVRDAILLGLEAAWAVSGRKVTKKEVDARIARVADKLEELPAGWINEARLPALKFKDGKPLGKEAVRYLLYRQSRAKEIRPDVEAKPMYGMIDRETSGDYAVEILKQFLGSKVDAGDRWALSLAGLLGDDRIVPILNQQIRQWADSSRGKMAEYAVEALSLLGTDVALLTIDSLALRYRTKNKNVGRAAVDAFAAAAENLGITPDELGDRVVPWLGFEPGRPRLIDCGGKKVEARISTDLKLQFIDLEKNKPLASLPKSAPKDVLAEFKELGATLREVVKAQVLRLENLMVRQQRWPVDRWSELFTTHPVLLPVAVRLIWGVYGDAGKLQAAFRTLEDRTFTQATDLPFELPAKGRIGIVHPLELTEDQRKAWQTHLADYEITPPFPQLERPVVQLAPDRAGKKSVTEYAGTNLNGMTFKGRADRFGWTRGSVCDAGSITTYFKSFPAAGVDVFLGLDGMYIGIDMSAEIELKDAFFVRAGSVKTGSYTYDEPGNENDDRVLRFGDVPPIVYSEVLGDLQKIAGKNKSGGDGEE